ncbi:MAG TPA: vanadium-dependent haloperoxidase [Pilimelia sp.]|nr:vanadium-dependent haloperoxidase [Pilimelia sp.]
MRSVLMRRWFTASAATLLLTTIIATPATAGTKTARHDPGVVTDWNAIAVSTLVGDTSKTVPETALYMGFVHAAVYDATVGVDRRYEPYRFHRRAPHGTSVRAAVVAAAYQILVTYSPSAKATLDARYAESLARIPDGQAKTKGIAYGIRVADNLIRLRSDDGRNAPIVFDKPPAPGVWRPTPPAMLPMTPSWLGQVTPLLVRSAAQFDPGPPPRLTSARYTRDVNEVKAFGSATSTARTEPQTQTARFFSGNAVVQYNAALRDQVTVRGLDLVDAARTFAAIDMSIADSVISGWYAKFQYGLWRPITAITLADTDGNPATTPDPAWVSLIPAPPYPEYPSGYNVINGTVTAGLARLFHTRHLRLTLTSTAVPDVRFYDSGRALDNDVVDARVWLGIHFRFGDTAARDMSQRLVRWTLYHYFQPVG